VSYVRERPASLRFSTSEIQKMTADDITALRESKRSRKRSSKRRSRAAAKSSWTPGALAVVVEVDEQDVEFDGSIKSTDSILQAPSPAIEVEEVRPVPPLPPHITRSQLPSKMDEGTDESLVSDKAEITHPTAFSCFLQVGREDKMVTIESGMSFASLRALFVEKFSYNPGMENFPAIHIRDPSSGVRYELEEVKEQCLLSLNIECESACYL
jgi:hypothetical protein